MFSDLVGSTALSARMDPEDLRKIISAYQKCVTETVGRFGGFVASMHQVPHKRPELILSNYRHVDVTVASIEAAMCETSDEIYPQKPCAEPCLP
jgi:class 3 adenylate cyclase